MTPRERRRFEAPPWETPELRAAEEQMVKHEVDAIVDLMMKVRALLPADRMCTEDEVLAAIQQVLEDDPDARELFDTAAAFTRFRKAARGDS